MSEVANFNEFSELDLFKEDAVADFASHGVAPMQDDRMANLMLHGNPNDNNSFHTGDPH